jgi:hypothetical protein
LKIHFFYAFFILIFAACGPTIYKATNNDLSFGKLKDDNNQNNTLSIPILKDSSSKITNSYSDKVLGLTYVYEQQYYKNIKVFNAIKSLVYKDGVLQSEMGDYIVDIASKTSNADPVISGDNAIIKAAEFLKINPPNNIFEIENTFNSNKTIKYASSGISKSDIKVELVWVSNDDGKSVQLAWSVNIDLVNSSDFWNININAIDGNFINKNNYTVYEQENQSNKMIKNDIIHELNKKDKLNFTKTVNSISSFNFLIPPSTTSASYNVIPYPFENRFVGKISNEISSWSKAGVNNNAITHGWHFDGITNYNYTRGNNVAAYDDSLKQNTPGRYASSTSAMPSLNFNFIPDFTIVPTDPINRRFATSNLFYWNNIMHDIYYQYGFDEVAGNFQNDNMGRGGLGGDYVYAEAQDGGGTDNANFLAFPDGGIARMQMYLSSIKLVLNTPFKFKFFAKEGNLSIANNLNNIGTKTGNLVLYNNDLLGTINNACSIPVNDISGKIALIYRGGGCAFVTKIKNAQNAGAIGVIMVDTVVNSNLLTMAGVDNTIVIPSVMIRKEDGDYLKTNIANNFNLSLGAVLDWSLDNGIIAHEYAHGISVRLTGGPSNSSCLTNYEQGGEGWSDYIAMMTTTDWSRASINDGSKSRPIGTYVEYQDSSGSGIRTYPYSTNLTINPHTYNDISDTINHPRIVGGVKITNATAVHYIGEVWCSALWDMTWFMIQKDNAINPNLYDASGNGGNVKALNLVIQGMKLQGCNPGFLKARDAILKADSLLYQNKYHCEIWTAFARRGMGYSASEGSSNNTIDQIPAFDLPPTPLSTITSLGPTTFCANSTDTLISSVVSNIQWYKDNIAINGATDSTYITKSPGVYKVLVNNSSGCARFSLGTTLIVNPISVAGTLSITAQQVCINTAATPITLSGNTGTIIWQSSSRNDTNFVDINPVKTGQILSDIQTGTSTTTYYRAKVTSGVCTPVISPTATVIIDTLSVAGTLTLAGTSSICYGTNAPSISLSGNKGSVIWQSSTTIAGTYSTISGTASLTIKVGDTNSLYYRAKVTNGACSAITTSPILITVNPLPSVPFITASGPTSFCEGANVVLSSSPASTYLWNNGEKTQNITTFKTGIYFVNVFDVNGCTSKSLNKSITVNPIPTAPIITRDTANYLVSSSLKNVWFKDGIALFDSSQRVKYNPPGLFSAKAVQNGCVSALSMPYYMVTDIINISKDEFIKFAPNPFVNQLNFDFVVKGYQKLNMEVFDIAGGTKVSIKQNLIAGMPIYLGQLSAGTYLIKVTSNDGKINYQFKMIKL